jgi:hypothetical protein
MCASVCITSSRQAVGRIVIAGITATMHEASC